MNVYDIKKKWNTILEDCGQDRWDFSSLLPNKDRRRRSMIDVAGLSVTRPK